MVSLRTKWCSFVVRAAGVSGLIMMLYTVHKLMYKGMKKMDRLAGGGMAI